MPALPSDASIALGWFSRLLANGCLQTTAGLDRYDFKYNDGELQVPHELIDQSVPFFVFCNHVRCFVYCIVHEITYCIRSALSYESS